MSQDSGAAGNSNVVDSLAERGAPVCVMPPLANASLKLPLAAILVAGTGYIGLELWLMEGPALFGFWSLPHVAWVCAGLCLPSLGLRLAHPSSPSYWTSYVCMLLAAIPVSFMLLLGSGELPFRVYETDVVADLIVWSMSVAALWLAVRWLVGKPASGAVVVAIALGMPFLWLDGQSFSQVRLWHPIETESSTDASEFFDDNQVMFAQSGHIDAVLERLPTPDPEPSVFVVGFAGYAEEKVFAEEVRFAADALASEFRVGQRRMLLINDQRAGLDTPLATVPGLRHVLTDIGQRMRSDDVLFLVLSSHGSRDASLSVSNGPLFLRDLRAESLKDALDSAGIRWRVILVSACFSGSFIEPLADSNTIILTAADAESTSFGCSNSRDLTYFGEAFYRDALPGSASLRSAFEAASAQIAKRESAEGLAPSNPTAWFGADLAERLRAVRLKNHRDPAE